MFTEQANKIFERSIADYHNYDNVDHPIANPYTPGSIEHLLYHKNWIDTVQWHLEDIIRDPNIDPTEALQIKRRIDASNQERTDMVEFIDSWMLDRYKDVQPAPDARINTERRHGPSTASRYSRSRYTTWNRSSRTDTDEAHRTACSKKLAVLLTQKADLSIAIEELLDDIESGRKYMKSINR